MHVLVFFGVCMGLYLLFPKGFKYVVGTWLGFVAGVLAWIIVLFTVGVMDVYNDGHLFAISFYVFAVLGIALGCWLAAKG